MQLISSITIKLIAAQRKRVKKEQSTANFPKLSEPYAIKADKDFEFNNPSPIPFRTRFRPAAAKYFFAHNQMSVEVQTDSANDLLLAEITDDVSKSPGISNVRFTEETKEKILYVMPLADERMFPNNHLFSAFTATLNPYFNFHTPFIDELN